MKIKSTNKTNYMYQQLDKHHLDALANLMYQSPTPRNEKTYSLHNKSFLICWKRANSIKYYFTNIFVLLINYQENS